MVTLAIPKHLEQARAEHAKIEQQLVDPNAHSRSDYRELTQRYAWLRDLIQLCEEWTALDSSIAEEVEMWESEEELRGGARRGDRAGS